MHIERLFKDEKKCRTGGRSHISGILVRLTRTPKKSHLSGDKQNRQLTLLKSKKLIHISMQVLVDTSIVSVQENFAKSFNIEEKKLISSEENESSFPKHNMKLTGSSFLLMQGSKTGKGLVLAAARNLDFGHDNRREVFHRLRLFEDPGQQETKEEVLVNLKASFNSAFSTIPASSQLEPMQLFAAEKPATSERGAKRQRAGAFHEVTPPTEYRDFDHPVEFPAKHACPRFMPLRVISSPIANNDKDLEKKAKLAQCGSGSFGGMMHRCPSYEEFTAMCKDVVFKPVASEAAYPHGDLAAFGPQEHMSAVSKHRKGLEKDDYSASLPLHFHTIEV